MVASRWPKPLGSPALLLFLLGCFAASVPPVAAGVLRQVVVGEDATGDGPFFEPFNVTYDHRAVRIGGERRMLVSAGFHYPRATPEMWPSLIAKCKEGGADVIETYVFWNGHELAKGQYYFGGRFDLVKFAKLVAAEGLFLFLRIGPYACAEWNFGGFPIWLRDIPGIEFRTDNEPFKAEMQTFVTKIVDIMKEEKLYSWQGGPIILQQIENEYGNIQDRYGEAGKRYMQWAAQMALGLDTGVPWVMCRQTDAPEQILNTCNAYYCDGFKPNSYNKPTIWTEDWDGWYADWGEPLPHRPAQDNAFAVARFYQRGGSLQNYYMFFGGTNFERTAGGPLQITSYDYDAPIDEYGILRQPKWGHLKDLHAAIKLCEPALTAVDGSPQYVKLGPMQEAHIYSTEKVSTNGRSSRNAQICSAFLANIDEHKYVSVWIFGKSYNLPPWSVSILPDCENVAFNTATVGTQTSVFTVESGSPSYSSRHKPSVLTLVGGIPYLSSTWWTSKEPIGTWGNSFAAQGILEHLNVTKDISDYLWYSTSVNISDEDVAFWSSKGVLPTLTIDKIRDVARVFANGKLAGSKVGKWVSLNQPVQLVQGLNELALLSEIVGIQNYGAFLEKDGAGFRGQIKLTGLSNGDIDLTNSLWTYQIGLKGEFSMIYSPEKQGCSEWSGMQKDDIQSPFTWYKTMFDAPEGTDPVAIGLGSMGKGQAWVNGHLIGRYWSLVAPESGCPSSCNYAGAYGDSKCRSNCGMPTQSWYHIPREWLQESGNLLVLFEETGGDPSQISLEVHYTKIICSRISENYYPPLSAWSHVANGRASVNTIAPQLHLQCDDGHVISKITFASYGTPSGDCQNFSVGKCHASSTLDLVTEACVGKNKCAISVTNDVFGDPCRKVVKDLAVEAECSPPSATKEPRDEM
ncbi:beta-galactosidase 15 isoform X1 [Phragmites australis]|uniref:beta-galactosidase 15 isoform X1 n=1 Tax=Phragmites australis TaxID=29695 RepID=UPI002D7A22B8|nr:beta-galactosidase 15 isoform X1 [Phragmites australis]